MIHERHFTRINTYAVFRIDRQNSDLSSFENIIDFAWLVDAGDLGGLFWPFMFSGRVRWGLIYGFGLSFCLAATDGHQEDTPLGPLAPYGDRGPSLTVTTDREKSGTFPNRAYCPVDA